MKESIQKYDKAGCIGNGDVFMNLKPQLQKLSAYIPGRSVETIQKIYQLAEIHKLASNENPYGCSKKVSKAIHEQFKEANIYPDGSAEDLRVAVAKHLNIKESQLLFGAGVDEVIQMISRALLLPGENIVQADLTFSQYAHHAIIEGADVKRVSLIDGVHDLAGMLEAIDEQTKIVWVCNPNNPTGTMVDQVALLDFVRQVPEHILVVLDEAYFEYATCKEFPQTLPWINTYENVMVLRTFSKIYGLAAYRIGYGVANERLIEQMNVARLPFNTSKIAQIAAIGALKGQKFVEKCAKRNAKGRSKLEKYCQENGLKFYPSEANFVYIEIPNAKEIALKLEEKGFIVRAFLTGIRVTIPQEDVLKKFIRVFSKICHIEKKPVQQ